MASPVNNKVPATAADGTNPPVAKEEKIYIKFKQLSFLIISIYCSYFTKNLESRIFKN